MAYSASAATLDSFECPPDRLLVRPTTPPEMTAGGVIIPAGAGKRMMSPSGTVLKQGAKCEWVRPGDLVFYHEACGYYVILDGEPLTLLREVELLGRSRGEQ